MAIYLVSAKRHTVQSLKIQFVDLYRDIKPTDAAFQRKEMYSNNIHLLLNLLLSDMFNRHVFFGLTLINLIQAWMSNHMPNEIWDESIYPFLNLNDCTAASSGM